MSDYLPFTCPDTAPEASRATLAAVGKQFGFVPNLLGGLANSPSALHAYLGLAEQFAASNLSAAERDVVLLAVSIENGCEYCVAAHTVIAGKTLASGQIDALRRNLPIGERRLDALARFTRAVVARRGWPEAADLVEFQEAGFDRSQALDVLVGVAQKTLSNYANHLLGTPLDAAFEGARWDSEDTRR